MDVGPSDALRLGLTAILFAAAIQGYAQSDGDPVADIKKHRQKQEDELRDPKKSPLEKKERKRFKGLNYYDIDLSYRVKVRFVKTENPSIFQNEDNNFKTARLCQVR